MKRRKEALKKSKVGLLLALLYGAMEEQLRLIQKGKRPLGLSPRELHTMLTEFSVVLINVRDAYVEERYPRDV